MDMRKMETHVFSYRHDGRHWELTIKATDEQDARARIGKLAYATYDGVEVSRQPIIVAPVGILAVWVRNATQRLISRFC
jgi:hypothetical protein